MKASSFTRILCPVTFSENSRQTVEGAAILARMHDAELRLLHVVRGDGLADGDTESLIASLFTLSRRLQGRVRVSAAVSFGEPPQEIGQHARLTGADVIVLGTALTSTPVEALHSVPALVAADAPCPVLLVRPAAGGSLADGGLGFSEILCCVDSLPSAMRNAQYAFMLADRTCGRVTHVSVSPEEEDAADLESQVDIRVLLTGSPGPEIVALAGRMQSDLIVIDVRTRGEPPDTIGSATARVVAHAPCHVLIVPPHGLKTIRPLLSTSIGRLASRLAPT